MIKETIENKIESLTKVLLEMARESCWNTISDNCVYIMSEIKEEGLNFSEQRKRRKKINEKKEVKSIEEISANLERIYSNLYDVNLHIYKAERKRTIIEIRYFSKSSLDKEFLKEVNDKEPMFHCKVAIPPYQKNKSEKYDVNWELGGVRHEWKMFWARRNKK